MNTLTRRLCLFVPLVVLVVGPTVFLRHSDKVARDREVLVDRTLATYVERFRDLRRIRRSFLNSEIDAVIRAELPELVEAEAPDIAAILATEPAKRAVDSERPPGARLTALFVMGDYQAVAAEGEKVVTSRVVADIRMAADASLALFYEDLVPAHKQVALEFYEAAARFMNKDGDPLIWVEIQSEVARLHAEQGHFGAAELLQKKIVAILLDEKGEDSIDYGRALGNLGLIEYEQGSNYQPEPLLRKALSIYEDVYGPEDLIVAEIVESLGNLLSRSGRPEEAEPFRRRASALRKATLGSSLQEVTDHVPDLVFELYAKGKVEEAMALWRKAIPTNEAHLEENSGKVKRGLKTVGWLDELEPVLRRRLAIEEAKPEPDGVLVGILLDDLVGVLVQVGLSDEAESWTRRGPGIREKISGGEAQEANKPTGLTL